MFPKTRAHVKCYDGVTKCTHFLIEYDELLKNMMIIRNKVSNSINKEFDSESIYKKIV